MKKIIVPLAAILTLLSGAFFVPIASSPAKQSGCSTVDFTQASGGFSVVGGYAGTWNLGSGWSAGDRTPGGGDNAYRRIIFIGVSFPSMSLTSVDLVYDYVKGSSDVDEYAASIYGSTYADVLDSHLFSSLSSGSNLHLSYSGADDTTSFSISIWSDRSNTSSSGFSGGVLVKSVTFCGTGLYYPTNTAVPDTPIPCGDFLCVNVGTFYPPCTPTPSASYTASPTASNVDSTHVFPTVPLMTPIVFPTIGGPTKTNTPGPTTTRTPTPYSPTATLPVSTPTVTATLPCSMPVHSPIAGFGEHDIPGGACYRLFPPISINIDAVSVFGTQIVPAIHIIAHPVDLCYTIFKLDVTLGPIDLWNWLILIFDLWLVSWIINVIRANG